MIKYSDKSFYQSVTVTNSKRMLTTLSQTQVILMVKLSLFLLHKFQMLLPKIIRQILKHPLVLH